MKTIALKISNIHDTRPIIPRKNYIVLFAYMSDAQIKNNIEILQKALQSKKKEIKGSKIDKIRAVK